MAVGADFYTELIASTLENIERKLVDQVLTAHPTLDLFKRHSSSKTGRKLVLPLIGAENTSTALTDAAGTFSTTADTDIIGSAEFDWSSPLVSKTRVNWLTLQKNSGKEALFDLAKVHIEAMVRGHAKKLATLLHNRAWNGTATEIESGQFFSLDQIVANGAYEDDPNGAAVGTAEAFTVGGISGTAKAYWNAQRISRSVASFPSLHAVLRELRDDIIEAGSGVEGDYVIVAGRDVFTEYEAEFDERVRYTSMDKAESRFRELTFDGMKVRFDPDCPAKRAYMLDTDAIRFAYLNGNFMKVQPSQVITGTLDKVTPAASVIAVGTNERRAHGLLLRPDADGGAA